LNKERGDLNRNVRFLFIQLISNPTSFRILNHFFNGKSEDAPTRQEMIEIIPEHERIVDASLSKLRQAGILQSDRNEENLARVTYSVRTDIERWKFQILENLFGDCN
jgi:DNA-binding HxlR family transcriptional regulator